MDPAPGGDIELEDVLVADRVERVVDQSDESSREPRPGRVEGMLEGLSAGLDALRDLGVPIEVPPPAEYVALGAARQATHTLLGR